MPALTTVNNTFGIHSTIPNFDCGVFDDYKTRGKILGAYDCFGKHQITSGANLTLPASPSSTVNTQPSGLSGGAKGGIAVGSILGSFAVAIGIIFYLRRRRSKKIADDGEHAGVDGKAEMDTQEVGRKGLLAEMDTHEDRKELSTGGDAHELFGEHGVVEMGENKPEERYELASEPVLPQKEKTRESFPVDMKNGSNEAALVIPAPDDSVK